MDYIFRIATFSFGLVFMMAFGNAFLKGLRARHWQSVPGRVVYLGVETTKNMNRQDQYGPIVRYEYQFAGKRYVGANIRVIARTQRHQGYALGVLNDFSIGQQVVVYVNADAPCESVLKPGLDLIGLPPVLFGAGLMIISFFF